MFKDRRIETFLKRSLAVTLLCTAAFSFNAVSPLAASGQAETTPVRFVAAPQAHHNLKHEARLAAATFVWGLSNGHSDVVWQFATEEEQAAFATEDETYSVFVQAYPPLAYATDMTFETVAPDGDLHMVSLYVKDRLNLQWRASFGLWKDDAGDWKVLTLAIEPAPGELV